DLYGGFQERIIDARPFAQYFGRAGAGATAAEDVGAEDRPGGAEVVLVHDLADEGRHVDVRRAGAGARGVEAIETPRRLDERFVLGQWGRHVGEATLQDVQAITFTRLHRELRK